MSWNGATEVATWQLLAGSAPEQLDVVAAAAKRTFETGMPVPTGAAYVAVQALGAEGKVLGTSKVVPTATHDS